MVEKLKKKHGDNKEELQKAMWEFQKQQGITPILGCLPMFLQMPIWIALWSALNSTFELRHAVVQTGGQATSPELELARLLGRCDSELERAFLRLLHRSGHRLPTHAQRLLEQAGVRPDFDYVGPSGQVAVFVDGPDHDAPAQQDKDEQDAERLEDLGWSVLRFRYDEDDRWEDRLRAHAWVFGPGTSEGPA